MKVTQLNTEEDYTRALGRIKELRESSVGHTDGDELDRLIDAVSAYEKIRYSIDVPSGDDAVERSIAEFRRLSGQGDSRGWCFNRDELYERR